MPAKSTSERDPRAGAAWPALSRMDATTSVDSGTVVIGNVLSGGRRRRVDTDDAPQRGSEPSTAITAVAAAIAASIGGVIATVTSPIRSPDEELRAVGDRGSEHETDRGDQGGLGQNDATQLDRSHAQRPKHP